MALRAGVAYLDIEPRLDVSWRRDIDRHTDGAANNMESRFGGAFKRIGLALGGLFAAKLGVDFGRELLELGSQTDVFRQKAKTVFEAQNADVTRWAKANASAFGLTDDRLSGLAANFGDLLKPMGFTSKQAADMSTKVVGLSGALSAWSGGQRTAAEVSETLSKAMLGEREELKGLGISISQADVDARLFAKGQKDLTGAALQQASAVATQELIFEKSTDAQKAWADGSFDAIKKQNALKEKIGELKEDLADKLRPAFAAAVGIVVDKFLPAMERIKAVVGDAVAPVIRTVVLGAKALFSAFKEGDVTSDGFVGVMERIGVALRGIVGFIRNALGQVKNLVALFKSGQADAQGFAEILDNVFGNTGRLVGVFRTLYDIGETIVDFVKANLTAVFSGLGAVLVGGTIAMIAFTVATSAAAAAAAPLVVTVGVAAGPFIALGLGIAGVGAGLVLAYQRFEGFRDVVDGVARFLVDKVAPAVAMVATHLVDQLGNAVDWVKKMWPQISEAIGHVLRVAKEIIGVFVDTISALWRAWGDDLLRIARTIFDYIRGTIDNVLQVIRGVIQTVLAIINGDWGRAWDGIKQVFAGIWDQITNVLRTAIGVLRSVVGGIVSAFGEVLRPLGNFLHTWIVEPLETVVGFVRGMPGKIAAAASGMWNGIVTAFKAAINAVIRLWNNLRIPGITIGGWDPPGPGPSFPSFTTPAVNFPNIPTLHTGGIFRADTPGGEGLALLKDRERVLAPGVAAPEARTPIVFGPGSVVVQMPEGVSPLQAELATERAVLKALGHIEQLGA